MVGAHLGAPGLLGECVELVCPHLVRVRVRVS